MNKYTFKGQYGDSYSFSDDQIERNPYLDSEEKRILRGLAAWQSNPPKRAYGSSSTTATKYSTDYKGLDFDGKRKTLTKTPAEYEFAADLADKRWYESYEQFVTRKCKAFVKANTKRVKEVRRDRIEAVSSTYEDGTVITEYSNDSKYFI